MQICDSLLKGSQISFVKYCIDLVWILSATSSPTMTESIKSCSGWPLTKTITREVTPCDNSCLYTFLRSVIFSGKKKVSCHLTGTSYLRSDFTAFLFKCANSGWSPCTLLNALIAGKWWKDMIFLFPFSRMIGTSKTSWNKCMSAGLLHVQSYPYESHLDLLWFPVTSFR